MITELTDQNFMDAIKSDTVVLDMFATWCLPCRPVADLLERLSMKYQLVKFYKVNVEKCPSAAAYTGVSNLPTVYILHAGECKTSIFTKFDTAVEKELKKYCVYPI